MIDPGDLDDAARRYRREGELLERAASDLRRQLAVTTWEGTSATRFRRRNEELVAELERMAAECRHLAAVLSVGADRLRIELERRRLEAEAAAAAALAAASARLLRVVR